MQNKTIILITGGSLLLLLIPAGVFIWTMIMAILLAHSLTRAFGSKTVPVASFNNGVQIRSPQSSERTQFPTCSQITKISAEPGCPQFSDTVCSFMRLSGICQKNNPDNTDKS